MATSPDLDNLITVDATVQQDAEHGSVDLLHPFISALANSGQVSRLKLKTGNEAGVSLSLDGNHLIIDLSAYSYISEEGDEQLCYKYRINDAQGRYSQNTATITLSMGEHGSPAVSTVRLTTNNAFDYTPDSNNEDTPEDGVSEPQVTPALEDDYSLPEGEQQKHDLANNKEASLENEITAVPEAYTPDLTVEIPAENDGHIPQGGHTYNLADDDPDRCGQEGNDLTEKEVEPIYLGDQEEVSTESEVDSITVESYKDDRDELESVDPFSINDTTLAEELSNSEEDDNSVTFHFTPQPTEAEAIETAEETKPSDNEGTTIDPFSYDELATELPLAEEDDPEIDINLDQIISEVDQAISQADRLMDSALNIHTHESTRETELDLVPDDVSSEHALSGLIDKLPEDHNEETVSYDEAEEELEHLIERVPDSGGKAACDDSKEDSHLHKTLSAPAHTPLFDQTITIESPATYIFDLSDFDSGQPGLNQIRIDTLPVTGTLFYNKEPVEEKQIIQRKELLTGRLSFNPDLADSEAGNIEFIYSACFGDQSFAHLSATGNADVLVTIDISANTEDSLVGSGDIKILATAKNIPEFIAGSITGSYGELTINSNGYWVYEASRNLPALKALLQDSQLLETFSVPLEDGGSCSMSFHIYGPYEAAKLVVPS